MNFTYKVLVLNQTPEYIRTYQIILLKKVNFDIFAHLKINDFSIQLPYIL